MRAVLSVGGQRIRGVANPQTDQDGVSLRTLQTSEARVLQEATAAANTAVGDAIANHLNIWNRDIRTKNLNLDPQGTTTKISACVNNIILLGFQIQHLNTRLSISER